MAKTREIKGRMKAVGNIQRITKTMQMIATARFTAAMRRATASRPYSEKIAELVGEVAAAGGRRGAEHPLLKSPDPAADRELVLLITSNRGLCGGYNASLIRRFTSYLAERPDWRAGERIQVELVGRKAAGWCRYSRTPVAAFHSDFGDQPRYEQIEQLAERYMAEFIAGRYDAVKVIHQAFESAGRQYPTVTTLLPLRRPQAAAGSAQAAGEGDRDQRSRLHGQTPAVDYDFSPAASQLLAELLPATVKVRLYQCFNEAVVSEHVARMKAMKAATDAAGDMRKRLGRQFNRARQTAITTELSEIIGGSAALQ
jgi:F-type H+-transporting ATPase subunit gamma